MDVPASRVLHRASVVCTTNDTSANSRVELRAALCPCGALTIENSNIRALLGMPLQIPAGQVTRVGKEGVDAGPGLRRVKHESGLPVFLQNRVVVPHHDRTVRIPVGGRANAKNREVDAEGQRRGQSERQNRPQEDLPYSRPEVLCANLIHEHELYPWPIPILCVPLCPLRFFSLRARPGYSHPSRR